MTADKINTRIEELRNLAKQHEATLLQISGAIQELHNVLAEMSKEAKNAADQVNDPQSNGQEHQS